jgi:tRNA pseudouridine13 synthase
VLAERVAAGNWNRLLPGDVANLEGRGSVFPVETPDDELTARCARGDIHPTGPMVGDEPPMTAGEVAGLEQQVSERFPEVLAVVRAQRMKGERRALRIAVRDFSHQWEQGTLRLSFTLPAGAFATVVLRELTTTQDAV